VVEGIGGLSPPFLVLSERPVGLYPDENHFLVVFPVFYSISLMIILWYSNGLESLLAF
jgi:hypothetical protein